MNDPPSSTIFFGADRAGLVLHLRGRLARRATTRYNVTDRRIHIRTGIVSRHEHSAQLGRVQNVNVTQTMFQRLLGIGDVDWDTAGTEEASSEFRFRGVDDPSAIVRVVDERLHDPSARRSGGERVAGR